jgi:branched-chain amino acid transport system substrate-binding protein
VDTKHLVRAAVPLAVGAVLLSACGGSSSGGGGGSSGGGKSFSIGYQGPLSGGNAALGINMNNGVKLAIDQANSQKVLPYTLKLVSADDQGSPQGSPTAAQKEIGDSSVIAVVGPAFSGATDAAGKLYKAANLLIATPSATLPTLTSEGFTTF